MVSGMVKDMGPEARMPGFEPLPRWVTMSKLCVLSVQNGEMR